MNLFFFTQRTTAALVLIQMYKTYFVSFAAKIYFTFQTVNNFLTEVKKMVTKEIFTYHNLTKYDCGKSKFLQTILLAQNQKNLSTIIPENSTFLTL